MFESPGEDMTLAEHESLDSLQGLNFRAHGRLRYAKITTVGELVALTEDDLLDIPHMGQLTLANIKAALAAEDMYLKDR